MSSFIGCIHICGFRRSDTAAFQRLMQHSTAGRLCRPQSGTSNTILRTKQGFCSAPLALPGTAPYRRTAAAQFRLSLNCKRTERVSLCPNGAVRSGYSARGMRLTLMYASGDRLLRITPQFAYSPNYILLHTLSNVKPHCFILTYYTEFCRMIIAYLCIQYSNSSAIIRLILHNCST